MTPVGLREPWVWIQPRTTDELLARLADARDFNVHERERENLCSVAHGKITKLVSVLIDCLEYFELREDASTDSGDWQGNKEMSLATAIRELGVAPDARSMTPLEARRK